MAKHGKWDTPVWRAWAGMKSRCSPTPSSAYIRSRYYQRGIKVCPEWQVFEKFYEDMGDPPDGYTLERIDNDQGYSLSNCRWATYKEQSRNKSTTRRLTAFGKTQPLIDWAEETGISSTVILDRIRRMGLSDEQALSPLFTTKYPEFFYFGATLTLAAHCRRMGLDYGSARHRVRKGQAPEDAMDALLRCKEGFGRSITNGRVEAGRRTDISWEEWKRKAQAVLDSLPVLNWDEVKERLK